MKTRFDETRTQTHEFFADGFDRLHSLPADSRTILLISNDRELHEKLRPLVNEAGLLLVRVDIAVGTVEVLEAVRPNAVLLDLDAPDEAAWKTADILFNEPDCPVVILLTGRSGHFGMQTAIRAGLLASKNDPPARLLEIIEKALDLAEANQAQRNTVQRELIRWLSPPARVADSTSAYRFWGINE